MVSEPDYDAIPTFEGEQVQEQQEYENNSTPPPVFTLQEADGKVEEA